MKITRPDGFVVNEIKGDYGPGDCTHFKLKKTGWNTIDAIKAIAKSLGVSFERFGYAGLKDKNAVTTQRVSAWRVPVKKLIEINIKGLELSDFEEGKERVKLGSHKGNRFIIRLEEFNELKKPDKVLNYFGEQRLGGNELLGKALIDDDLKKAVDLIKKSYCEKRVIDYLKKNPGDYLRALRIVDKKIRVLWLNAWQSSEWNNELSKLKIIPKKLVLKPCKAPSMPELGLLPGVDRDTIMKVTNYKVTKIKDGFIIEFTLPRGSYATTLIKQLLPKRSETEERTT